MSVVILKNVDSEGPGTIEAYLRAEGIPYRIVGCATEELPDVGTFGTLVMLGGPMSVNETDIYPYLGREIELAASSIRAGRKVLGICLGAQIMARALGARVYAGSEKEIGWHDVELCDGGPDDPVMKRVASYPAAADFRSGFKVFHWHGETFDIPEGARRLAGSALYPNQAFRYGSAAYAFQFHLEVTETMIYEWLQNEPAVDMNSLKRQTEEHYAEYAGRARNFYRAFFG